MKKENYKKDVGAGQKTCLRRIGQTALAAGVAAQLTIGVCLWSGLYAAGSESPLGVRCERIITHCCREYDSRKKSTILLCPENIRTVLPKYT